MSGQTIPRGFVKSVLQNGVGRYVCQLQRLTIKFCKSHGSSRRTRDFIENHLLEFSRENPGTAVYVLPRRHRQPVMEAEYLNGNKETIRLERMPQEDICRWLEHLRTRSGQDIVRLQRTWHTDSPSIQGPWTPVTNRDTSWNVTEFPCAELSRLEPANETATERLLKMAEQLRLNERKNESEVDDSPLQAKC